MCGGISAALGARDGEGRRRPAARVAARRLSGRTHRSPTRSPARCSAARSASSSPGSTSTRCAAACARCRRVALVVAALVAFGALRDPGARVGRLLWPRLAPLGRRLLPVTSVPRALGFGMVWGWMPCGFAYTVHADRGARARCAALGRDDARVRHRHRAGDDRGRVRRAARGGLRFGQSGRRVAGAVLIAGAALTLFAPQIVAAAPWLHPWMQYLCRVD